MRAFVSSLALAVAIGVGVRSEVGCSSAVARGSPTALLAPVVRPDFDRTLAGPARVVPVPGTYWEPIDFPLAPSPAPPPDLPLPDALLLRSAGADARWNAAPAELRAAVSDRGFAVAPSPHPFSRLGDLYGALRDDRVSWIVTLDALFFLAHWAFDRALADVDAAVTAPALGALLDRLQARLAEERAIVPDLVHPFDTARALVDVARLLAGESPATDAGVGVAPLLGRERELVLAHAGEALSPTLGVPVDYAEMAPAGEADREGAPLRRFLAATWLEHAPLALEAAHERASRTRVDVQTARVNARAALLLARLAAAGADEGARTAWRAIERTGEVLVGESGEVTVADVAAAATAAALDPRRADWMANVVAVDRVRHAAAGGRPAPLFRMLAPRATPDGDLLEALVAPEVGGRLSSEGEVVADAGFLDVAAADGAAPEAGALAGDAGSPRLDGLTRTMPQALDVAAWLGSGEARAALRRSGADGFAHYEETLERLARSRVEPPPPLPSGLHRTPYLSMLDAIETTIAPSAGDALLAASGTSEWRQRKAEVAVAAWTEIRHDATTLTRVPCAPLRLPEHEAASAPVPIFVEPHPEAIAQILAAVRQLRRAVVAERMLPADAASLRVVDEVSDLLWNALGVAVYEAADQAVPPDLTEVLAAFPQRVRGLEAILADSGAAEVALSIDVHVDVASARVLAEGLAGPEEAWIAVREPASPRVWLAVGAAIPHRERTRAAAEASTDSAWRATLAAESPPSGDLLERRYRVPGLAAPPMPAPPVPAADGAAPQQASPAP